ncbi:MAG: hypothetical protein HBSAPP03_04850 [Phycisphaerae bacterium]|nr:MAG: hypothetical protein HBSAPP03_04850 [Phycisphaerae bacterium]
MLVEARSKYRDCDVREFADLSEADIDLCFSQGAKDWVKYEHGADTPGSSPWTVISRPTHLPGVPPVDAHRTLGRLSAAFLWRQFGARDAATYRAWREANHAQARPLDEVLSNRGEHAGAAYAAHFGKAPSADATFVSVFDSLWGVCQEQPGGQSRVVGMACDSSGVGMSVGWIPPNVGRARPHIQGGLGAVAWYAGRAGTMRSWYRRSRQWESSNMGQGGWCAEVGVIAEFGDGRRRPIVLTYFFSTLTGNWSLDSVNYYDLGEAGEAPWPLEY